MRGAMPPLPNTSSWRGAQLKKKAQGQLHLYLLPDKRVSRLCLEAINLKMIIQIASLTPLRRNHKLLYKSKQSFKCKESVKFKKKLLIYASLYLNEEGELVLPREGNQPYIFMRKAIKKSDIGTQRNKNTCAFCVMVISNTLLDYVGLYNINGLFRTCLVMVTLHYVMSFFSPLLAADLNIYKS
jgi:hypothetical protein